MASGFVHNERFTKAKGRAAHKLGAKAYRNPIKSWQATFILVKRFKAMLGPKKIIRAFKIDGKYLWDIYNSSWPSKGFNAFFTTHLHEVSPIKGKTSTMRPVAHRLELLAAWA
ncbi:MAG: hypothetical protein ACI8ZN_001211 [Bacteroidia bacterium]